MLFQVNKVSYSYADTPVLRDVSLGLEQGRFYGVLGPNGSGKTTFLDLLSGHRSPDAGRILLRGRALDSYGKRALSREIALVPQDFSLAFPFAVREIVLMGRYPHLPRFSAPSGRDLEIVRRAMEQTGTAEFGHRSITELSGGEKQRVVFARALAQQAPVLLLDEATSNLDVKFGLQLMQLARRKNRKEGVSVIAVFHDINQAACFCDALLFFKNGRLACFGDTGEILTAETLRRVFEVRAKVFHEPYLDALQAVFKPEEEPAHAAG
jgi:iron complex transport system ATP-binding protein